MEDLTSSELSNLLRNVNQDGYAGIFHQHQIDGSMICECKSPEELQKLGTIPEVRTRTLWSLIQELKAKGVTREQIEHSQNSNFNFREDFLRQREIEIRRRDHQREIEMRRCDEALQRREEELSKREKEHEAAMKRKESKCEYLLSEKERIYRQWELSLQSRESDVTRREESMRTLKGAILRRTTNATTSAHKSQPQRGRRFQNSTQFANDMSTTSTAGSVVVSTAASALTNESTTSNTHTNIIDNSSDCNPQMPLNEVEREVADPLQNAHPNDRSGSNTTSITPPIHLYLLISNVTLSLLNDSPQPHATKQNGYLEDITQGASWMVDGCAAIMS